MKNKWIKTGVLAVVAGFATLISSCQKEDMRISKTDASSSLTDRPNPDVSNFTGKIDVRLKDFGNAGVEAIELTFKGIALHYQDERVGQRGWIFLPSKPRLVDMLTYQAGAGFQLGHSTSLPLGVIDDIRITMGDPNFVVWGDGDVKHRADLIFSNADHMVDVDLHQRVDPQKGMIVVLGFNANESIKHTKAGLYFFKPHIFFDHTRYITASPIEQNPDPVMN